MRSTGSVWLLSLLPPATAVLLCIAVWGAIPLLFQVDSFILPSPAATLAAAIEYRQPLFLNAVQTLSTTLAGFGIALLGGVGLGAAIGSSRIAARALNPLLIGFNSVPKVALAPLLVLWFGIGTVPAILMAFLLSFFPIVVNVSVGIGTIEPELMDLLRSLRATKLDIVRKVGLPRSVPYLFASLKVALTLALVGSIVSETVGANAGLGHLVLEASASFRVPLLFAALIIAAVMGVGLYASASLVERWVSVPVKR